MASNFKAVDHVEWTSEAGRVRGTIQKKAPNELDFMGHKRHASKEEPQYIIKSDKTVIIWQFTRSRLSRDQRIMGKLFPIRRMSYDILGRKLLATTLPPQWS